MSRILDEGPETVRVYVEQVGVDTYGNTVRTPSPSPVEIRCTINPLSNVREDERTDTTFKLITREAPIGNWSRVEWNGETYSVENILRRANSPATTHVSVTLRREQ